MTSKAYVDFDPGFMGVRLALRREQPGSRVVVLWQTPNARVIREDDGRAVEADESGDPWLRLQEDDARAIYEALAEFFGHGGHDVRALRRDYDAERARVDKFIGRLLGGAS